MTFTARRSSLAFNDTILLDRGVEGFIAVDISVDRPLPLPTVAIPGHRRVKGVTNIVLDHRRAVWLALNHLIELGHSEIAFMKGSEVSPDSEGRWRASVSCRRTWNPYAVGTYCPAGRR